MTFKTSAYYTPKTPVDTYETNTSFSTINGGYTPKGLVTAISMMHESGTGGSAKYGIIPQMPMTSLAGVNILDNTTYWQKRTGQDVAKVGYFSTKLESGVSIELSAARHSGIISYKFPAGSKHVLVDLSHYLPAELGASDCQFFAGGAIKLSSDGKTYTGSGAYGGGFSESAPLTTYVCGEFEEAPDQARTFIGRNTDPMVGLNLHFL
jgi:putative alpha-1,2-mannosidase